MSTDLEELKRRIAMAREQLHSLANEYRHRRNGADFAEIDCDDLDEVIDMLDGKFY